MHYSQRYGTVVALLGGLAATLGCGSSTPSSFNPDGGGGDGRGGFGEGGKAGETGKLMGQPGMDGGGTSMDAFFAMDPPPMYCGVDGGMPPPVTGTLDCPSDKNREGCPCSAAGMTAACWPGLRVDRGLGVCKDGMTTCQQSDEGLMNTWGACTGYVLPTVGATSGAAACKCFSAGTWKIDNLSPCFIDYGANNGPPSYAVSTYINAMGQGVCTPPTTDTPPPTLPTEPWSTDTLTVDCEGQFKLCYTLKAGTAKSPSPSDCVVAGPICTSAYYTTANMPQAFPPLPAWVGTDPTCAAQFMTSGYGEMSVIGKSELCEPIDNGMGAAEVFNRVQYCPTACNANPMAAGCMNCMQGGSGGFGN